MSYLNEDYEGEAISIAYDNYVNDLYDKHCQQQEEEYFKYLEEQENEQDGR